MRQPVVFILVAMLFLGFFGQTVSAQTEKKGPVPDILYITAESNTDTAIQKVAAGSLDIFLWSLDGLYILSQPESVLSNLSLVKATSGYWEITLNPVHDEDNPYLITVNGTKYFNPFAIREVRFALNWLISRNYIVQNILQGSGAPMFGGIRPSTGANSYFEPVYSALGLTAEGNEYKALLMIDDAMQKAAEELAAQGYKLEKVNGTWYFEGEPVTITGIIRVEDLRKEEGLYVADLLEKAGFVVDRELVDRRTAGSIVYLTDSKEYKWNFYTAGWISVVNVKWPDDYTAFWYTDWYGWLPAPVGWEYKPTLTVKDLADYLGGADNAIVVLGLNYYNMPEKLSALYNWTIDDITKLLVLKSVEVNGKAYELEEGNADQYWDLQKISMALGIMDSVRVFTAEVWEYFITNKNRVSYIASDISSGLWTRWSLITAETPDKIVNVAEYSPTGALFMAVFNPIGGIDDIYSSAIWRVVRDYPVYTDLSTGTYIPVRCNYTVERGSIQVPSDAVVYNQTQGWVAKYAGETVKAKVTYTCKLSNWHDGQPMTLADFKYDVAFRYIWTSKDYPDDPYYDETLASRLDNVFMSQIKGYKFKDNGDGTVTITVYTDAVHPIADDVTANNNAIWPTLPWQLLYAMSELVARGEIYNITNSYAFSYGDEITRHLDLLIPEHVEDIEKVLLTLRANSSIPGAIANDVDDPTAGYEAIIDWINTHDHAVISNGPFYIDTYDPASLTIVLKAFRDPTYPFTPQDIMNLLQGVSEAPDTVPPNIFNVNVEPETQEVGNITTISWAVSDNTEVANVTLIVEQPDGTLIEKTFDPSIGIYSYNYTIPDVGTYIATIKAEDKFGNVNKVSIEFYGQKTIVETISISNETEQVTVQDEDIELGINLNETASTEGQIVVNVTVTTNEEELYEENITSLAVAPVVANTTEENETQVVAPVKYVAVNVETQTEDNENATNIVEKYTLKISYTDEEVTGIDETTLSVYYWNGTAWIRVVDYINQTIPNGPFIYDAGVNTEENYVWAVVDHFSVYALGGVPVPTVEITSPENNTEFFTNTTANVKITWIGKDELGIDHYEIKINDGDWINIGLLTEYTLENLAYGDYKVSIKAVNLAGKEAIDSVTFEVRGLTLSKHTQKRMNIALMWWMMYNNQLRKFDQLYNKSVELGIDNQTLQEALHYKELAEEYYKEAMEWGSPLKAFIPQQLRPLRLAYINILKAVKILEKALRTVS